MRHGSQIVVLIEARSLFVHLLKVVATVAEVEQIPGAMIAPVLGVVALETGEGVERTLWWHKLAHGTGGEGYLNATQTDVKVDIVFQDECSFQARVEEPNKD
jgi:hypothetical protein